MRYSSSSEKNSEMASHTYSFSHDPGLYKYEGKLTMSSHTPSQALDAAKSLSFTDEDVLVISYNKCGQTWMLNLVHLLYNADDVDTLRRTNTQTPWPTDTVVYIELQYESGKVGSEEFNSRDLKHRVVKSHLPVRFYKHALQTSKAKVIHVLRNPLDMLVSYYHFYHVNYAFGYFKGSWEEFFTMYKNKDVCWGDMVEHASDWFDFNKNREDSLIVHFEDMKRDLRGQVMKVASFLGKEFSDDVIDLVVEKLKFENMKKDSKAMTEGLPRLLDGVDPAIRKGHTGEWKKYFTVEQRQFIQHKIDSLATPVGLSFNET